MIRIRNRVLRGAVLMFIARVLVVGLGFFRFLVIAHYFGLGTVTDAYFLVNSIVLFVSAGVEGMMVSTFVPAFVQNREREGEEHALALNASLFKLLTGVFVALSLLTALFAPSLVKLIGPGLAPDGVEEGIRLLRLLAPVIVLSTFVTQLSCIYYGYQRFLFPALGSILPLAGSLVALVFFARTHGIAAIPVGQIAGEIAQILLLLIGLRKLLPCMVRHLGEALHPGVRRIARLSLPRFAGLSLVQLDLLIDKTFASLLGPGFLSAISYSGRIPGVATSMMTAPLGKSLLPHLSGLVAKGQLEQVRERIPRYLGAIAVMLLPACAFLLAFPRVITEAVFLRGAFSAQDVETTAFPLFYYSLGILFFGFAPLIRWTYFALQDTVTPLKVGIVASISNVLLNYTLMKFLRHGGIALSTSLVAALNTFLLLYLLRRHMKAVDLRAVLSCLWKPLSASLIMVFLLLALDRALLHPSTMASPVRISILAATGAFVYAGLCRVLRIQLRREAPPQQVLPVIDPE